MGESVVIRLGQEPGTATWVAVDDTGACLSPPREGPLAEAGPEVRGRRVVVLVPGSQVLRTNVMVPLRSGTRLLQALPFALEDTVADDVEDLHFAAGARQPDGRVAVAAIRRELLDQHLHALRSAGIEPAVMAADADALPEVPSTTTLLVEAHQVLLKEPGLDPVASDLDGLPAILELWLAQAPPPDPASALPRPRNLLVYDATDGAVPESVWEGVRPRVQSLELRRLGDGALPRLAAGAVAVTPLNLLQGEYGPRTSLASQWPRWRLAAGLAAGLAVAALLSLGAELWRLKQESAALASQVEAALRYTFPEATDLSNPRRILSGAGGGPAAGGTGQAFLESLGTVAEALTKTQNARLESLNYRAGVMELQIRAPSADALDNIRKLVVEGGRLNAEIQSANASGDQILGRLRITVAGA
jgi:general secretion pathway protein L